jgi:hypothetical protein
MKRVEESIRDSLRRRDQSRKKKKINVVKQMLHVVL